MTKNKKKFPAKQKYPKNDQVSIEERFVGQTFTGPLPHPSILVGYNNIQKGFADRIITLAEQEASHRHEMDKEFLNASIQATKDEAIEARMGQIFGLIIGLTAIIAGSYTAIQGAPVTGSLIGTSGVVGLVSAFILGRKKSDNNNDETQGITSTQNNTNSE